MGTSLRAHPADGASRPRVPKVAVADGNRPVPRLRAVATRFGLAEDVATATVEGRAEVVLLGQAVARLPYLDRLQAESLYLRFAQSAADGRPGAVRYRPGTGGRPDDFPFAESAVPQVMDHPLGPSAALCRWKDGACGRFAPLLPLLHDDPCVAGNGLVFDVPPSVEAIRSRLLAAADRVDDAARRLRLLSWAVTLVAAHAHDHRSGDRDALARDTFHVAVVAAETSDLVAADARAAMRDLFSLAAGYATPKGVGFDVERTLQRGRVLSLRLHR